MNAATQTSNASRSAVIPARQNPLNLRRRPTSSPPQQPKLLDRLLDALRSRHYSRRTEQCYRHWACLPRRGASRRRQVKRFIFFHHVWHPAEMAEPEVNAFLPHLATKGKMSASSQNQALSALLSCPSPLLRDAPVGGRVRHPDHSRTARAQRRQDDHGLHPRLEQGRSWSPQSRGCPLSRFMQTV
jgi:hypothetical protein